MAQENKELDAYIKKFRREPNIIGMFWEDPVALKSNLLESIRTGEPYDEYKLLSKEDQAAYDAGELLF
jgi:hypothetical protein